MLFNSLDFALFLALVFTLYWFVFHRNHQAQNLLVLTASYVFYGWWDWRFLLLIVISSLVDFCAGLRIDAAGSAAARKRWLAFSLGVNLGILGFFKYANFFIDSFFDAFALLGATSADRLALNLILPIGISFYTFQTLSYTIDIYKRKTRPTRDLVAFLGYVSFFPQLVAGPIETAQRLLPQFLKPRAFDYQQAKDGLRLLLWGLVKKIVFADRLGMWVDGIYGNYQDLPGSVVMLGMIYFAVQVYCDFSGYSDIARGTAKLFNFNLSTNFTYPFFSRTLAAFWRKWHITLSRWFFNYVYYPLAQKGVDGYRKTGIQVLTFGIIGLWHGADWSFVAWGVANGILINERLTPKHSRNPGALAEGLLMLQTFFLFALTSVLFRSPSLAAAVEFYQHLFAADLFSVPTEFRRGMFYVVVFFAIEWAKRRDEHPLQIQDAPFLLRWAIYLMCALLVVIFTSTSAQEFIYFQF